MKLCAMIPARIGSSRLNFKNLAIIDGKPLIYYAIRAAKNSSIFDDIVINSDHEIFGEVADRYGVSFYLRPNELGSSTAKSDQVVQDFIQKHPSYDFLIWVNSIAPLLTGSHIKKFFEYMQLSKLDSLIATEKVNVHANFKDQPINYKKNEVFAQTQDLDPIELFNYCLMAWKTDIFQRSYEENNYSLFCGNFGTYPINDIKVIVKTARDLLLSEKYLESNKDENLNVIYDDLTKNIKL